MQSIGFKMKYIGLFVGLTLVVALTLLACAPATTPETPKEKPGTITFAGGSVGGGSNLWCSAFAAIMRRELGLDATVLTYPINAMQDLVHSKVTDVGTPTLDTAYESYTATGAYQGKQPYTELRTLVFTGSSALQMAVPVDSDIKTFRDLVGKRVTPGQVGHSPVNFFKRALPVLGLSYDNDFTWVYMGHAEAAAALAAGKVDAYIVGIDPPQPTFVELDLTHPIRLVPFSEEDIKAITTTVPGAMRITIPAEFYHMDNPTLTWGIPSAQVGRVDMPEEYAYTLTKNSLEDVPFVRSFTASLADLFESPLYRQMVEGTMMAPPFHKGVLRYFSEIGWKVQPAMIPPEAK